jgi:hypothetical protein
MSDETSTLWNALKEAWNKYKELEKTSSNRTDFKNLETVIESLQKKLNIFDKPNQFEERWAKKRVTPANNTKIINNTEILGHEATVALEKILKTVTAEIEVLERLICEKDPEISKNPARVGQIINQVLEQKRHEELLRSLNWYWSK